VQLAHRAQALSLPLHLPLYQRLLVRLSLHQPVQADAYEIATEWTAQVLAAHGPETFTRAVGQPVIQAWITRGDTWLAARMLQWCREQAGSRRASLSLVHCWQGDWALGIVLLLRQQLIENYRKIWPASPAQLTAAGAEEAAAIMALLEPTLGQVLREEEEESTRAVTALNQIFSRMGAVSVEEMMTRMLEEHKRRKGPQLSGRWRSAEETSTDDEDSDDDSDDDNDDDNDNTDDSCDDSGDEKDWLEENDPVVQAVEAALTQHLQDPTVRSLTGDWIRFGPDSLSTDSGAMSFSEIPVRPRNTRVVVVVDAPASDMDKDHGQGDINEDDWDNLYQAHDAHSFPDLTAQWQDWNRGRPLVYTADCEEIFYYRLFPEQLRPPSNAWSLSLVLKEDDWSSDDSDDDDA
jgi:hypothetical protein